MTDAARGSERVDQPQGSYSGHLLTVASLIVTLAIAGWLHSIRVEVATFDSVRIFLSLILFQDYPAALIMLALIPLALLPALRDAGLRLARYVGTHPWQLFLLTVGTLSVAARFVYHAHPLAMDEYAAVFQSQVFAAGHLQGQLPPDMIDGLVPPGFQGHFFGVSRETGRVASMYWPGFALVLTPFTWLGVTWLANPLLGGVVVLLVHRLAWRLTDSTDAAGLAALLAVASPAVTVNAISLYSLTAHLVCSLAFVLLLLRPTFPRTALAGLVGSLALVLHNPVPHILVAIPWLVWLFGQRKWPRLLAGIVVGYAPLCVLIGFGWWLYLAQLTAVGHPIAATAGTDGWVSVWLDRLSAVNVFRLPGLHTLEDRLMALAKIWLWAVPGLMLLSLLGLSRSGGDVRVRLLGWSGLATLLGFLFVPVDQGHGWGFRYFHAAWFILPVLAVLAIWPIAGRPSTRLPAADGARQLAGTAAAWALISFTVLTGVRALQVESFIARHLAQLPAVSEGQAEILFVRSRVGYYTADLVQNDPFLRTRPIVMLSRGDEEDRKLLEQRFPEMELLASSPTGVAWGARSGKGQ